MSCEYIERIAPVRWKPTYCGLNLFKAEKASLGRSFGTDTLMSVLVNQRWPCMQIEGDTSDVWSRKRTCSHQALDTHSASFYKEVALPILHPHKLRPRNVKYHGPRSQGWLSEETRIQIHLYLPAVPQINQYLPTIRSILIKTTQLKAPISLSLLGFHCCEETPWPRAGL